MASPVENTPRYRNFSSNMPSSINGTPRVVTSITGFEKEPERDPEAECFMCRQANVYVKPIGVSQERRVARRQPPPLTRTQIDELSRKKQLTKQEVRKLLQCFFPEIKGVKYFQLHKYHSCCYDPKHLNLCKNHITALQHDRDQHPHHHNHDDGEGEPQNRVSFVRIKIEPNKGIPTRFLAPAALPESLADMLIKQVNRFENKKPSESDHTSQPYNVRRVVNPYGSDDEDEEDDSDDSGINRSVANTGNTPHDRQGNMKFADNSTNKDLVVEDLDEFNRLYNHSEQSDASNDQEALTEPSRERKRKKLTKKKTIPEQRTTKLKHWELLALEQSHQDTCNCRHQVMRLAADQVVYDWCRCKDHRHTEILDKHKPVTPPPPKQPATPPPPPPPPRRKPKARKVQTQSIGINATEPTTTELALAYDPSVVDYDMIQESVYYRTSSGRLIKPEMSNAFTYDNIPPSMSLHHQETDPKNGQVLYMTSDGQVQTLDRGQLRREKNLHRPMPMTSHVLSHPGSVYNGRALIDSSPNTGVRSTMPILALPTSSKQSFSDTTSGKHQPAEFTLAKFSSDKSIDTPVSRRTPVQSPSSDSPGRLKPVSMGMQKSSKPTFANQEPTPDYGRQTSVVANRRWFDQPLGDQNLRPVHDGQYGLIAGSSTEQHKFKSQLPENGLEQSDAQQKNGNNCIIS